MIYGYVRVSTIHQRMARQITNILEVEPKATIFKEHFTGTTLERPMWSQLLKKLKTGDRIIFDSVSRFARTAKEGFEEYKKLFEAGIDLVFINPTSVNKAVLRLYCTYMPANASVVAKIDHKVYATSADWDESSLSWAEQPQSVEKIADVTYSADQQNTWIEIDITDYIKENLGKVISISIKNEGADNNSNHVHFASRESGDNAPQLVIE